MALEKRVRHGAASLPLPLISRHKLFGITGAATAGTRDLYISIGFCCARERDTESVTFPA